MDELARPGGIVVLAHLMDQRGVLSAESQARADKAAHLSKKHGCLIICMGWNYRADTTLCISDAISSYLISAHGIKGSGLLVDRESRDTVGDAVFSKTKFLSLISPKQIIVVTSDYHVERARQIFQFVYAQDAAIAVVGVSAGLASGNLDHEQASLGAFRTTFDGVRPGDDERILETLRTRHPYYNGAYHPHLAL